MGRNEWGSFHNLYVIATLLDTTLDMQQDRIECISNLTLLHSIMPGVKLKLPVQETSQSHPVQATYAGELRFARIMAQRFCKQACLVPKRRPNYTTRYTVLSQSFSGCSLRVRSLLYAFLPLFRNHKLIAFRLHALLAL